MGRSFCLVEPMATCRIHEVEKKYRGIECPWEAWEHDPEGLCLLHSRQADKDQDGAFTEVVKAKLQAEDYNFRGVFFPGHFSLRKLTGQVTFTFAKPADFSGATFQGLADFSRATFQGEADFYRATFQAAYFTEATFQDANFSQATFEKQTDFFRATFKGAAWFVRINPHKEGEPPPPFFYGNFRDITVDKEAFLVFQDCSLAQVEFSDTDMRGLTFHNVDWHPYHAPLADFLIKKNCRFAGRRGSGVARQCTTKSCSGRKPGRLATCF